MVESKQSAALVAVIEGVQPVAVWDEAAAQIEIAAAAAEVEVRHWVRAESEDGGNRLAVQTNHAHVEVLPIDLGHRNAAGRSPLRSGGIGQRRSSDGPSSDGRSAN